ncbi:MAG: tyrosine--tRNA ligase [Deltaproteobacteria bacterium]|nr:MAG: tyrosine--tRNA ligase [Deltaproteobacteria bacterium]
MHVLEHVEARGLVQQVTDREALGAALDAGPVVFYAGFDPTADSLHAGHLLPVMLMRWIQQAGHRPIVVLGGATARIGDPTGKDKTREVLGPEQIQRNLEAQRAQLTRFLSFEGDNAAIMLDNAEWLMPWGYIDFLREIGRHFSVNRMLTAEGTRQRLERNQGLSFVEFNYHLLQSYDFLRLYQDHGCTLQVGGDDQWFHIVGGVDLIRRVEGAQAFGLTVPLLQTADGRKMGKTEGGALFLDPDKVSPYDYFQYWLNVHDDDVQRFLKLYTTLSLDEIDQLCDAEGAGLRDAKRVLARECTRLVHGDDETADADFVSRVLFSKGRLTEDERATVIRTLSRSSTFACTHVDFPLTWVDAAVAAGLCDSKGQARRLVKQGGARTWSERVTSPDDLVTGPAVLWAGKKKAALVV